jgi:hypothetical protein
MTTLEIGWEKIPENGWELNPRSQSEAPGEFSYRLNQQGFQL